MWLAFWTLLALAFNAPPLAPVRHATRCSPEGSTPEDSVEPLDEDCVDGFDDGGMGAEFNRHMLRQVMRSFYVQKRAAEKLRRIKRRKPRYLAYDDAAKWVQRMGQWDTAEEWQGWIESGEKRNPYIPNKPVEYYGDKWRGWDHFLNGIEDANNVSSIISNTSPPRSGE